MLASLSAFAQQTDLSGYAHFELRPVNAFTSDNPDAYEKFSSALAKNLEEYIARWAKADRVQKGGKRLIFEVSLLDDKVNSTQKPFWTRPLRGSRAAAQVKAIDAESGAVIAQTYFKEASGGTTTTGAMGSSSNRMVSSLAWRSSNYIIGLLSSQMSASPAGTGTVPQAPGQ